MAAANDLDRLKRRLRWEGAGPLTDTSNQALSALFARLRAIAQWVRQKGEEQPLISLLLAFLLGFAAGHWGFRRAKH
jgi:hypothetical protein